MSEEELKLSIRQAEEADYAFLLEMDHGYATEYVWQMELDAGHPGMGASFREARLPRRMAVSYPRAKDALALEWKQRARLLVAEEDSRLVGYAAVATDYAPGAAWLTDLVVAASQRRKGIGTRLALAAQHWARQQKLERLVLEMQSKNYPAIKLAQKLAFEFSGYNDRYYPNQDIALFFAKRLV